MTEHGTADEHLCGLQHRNRSSSRKAQPLCTCDNHKRNAVTRQVTDPYLKCICWLGAPSFGYPSRSQGAESKLELENMQLLAALAFLPLIAAVIKLCTVPF